MYPYTDDTEVDCGYPPEIENGGISNLSSQHRTILPFLMSAMTVITFTTTIRHELVFPVETGRTKTSSVVSVTH